MKKLIARGLGLLATVLGAGALIIGAGLLFDAFVEIARGAAR